MSDVLGAEPLITSMIDEWGDLVAAQQRQRAGRVDARVDAWEAALGPMVAEEASLRAAGQWYSGAADLLGIIGRSRRETIHCAIIAWLLDPSSPHGLGTALLTRVLSTLFSDHRVAEAELAHCLARCEVARARSRADIVVSGESLTLVVEAKVDAVERERQCDDLFADFSDDPGALFLFLTPRGRGPLTASGDARDAFRTLSFVALRTMLEAIVAEREASVRQAGGWHAVQTYLQTLEAEFR